MCDKSSGLDLGIGKLNLGDTLKTAMFGVIGTPVYDALVENPQKALEMQKQANQQAKDAATKQADLADQANNRAHAKGPDVMGLLAKNALDAKGGVSGTMLTGPMGVDPKSLLLGKTTLLGG